MGQSTGLQCSLVTCAVRVMLVNSVIRSLARTAVILLLLLMLIVLLLMMVIVVEMVTVRS
jgi:hypothetical protein